MKGWWGMTTPMRAPANLVLTAGVISMATDTRMTVQDYLRQWQERLGLEDGSAVCVISRKSLQNLYDRIYEQQNLTMSA